MAIKEKTLGPAHPDLATSLINLGVQRTLAGDPAAAKPLLERALAIREAAFGPDHVLVAGALQSLGGLLITLHDDAGAKVLLERAQRIRETVYGADHPDTVRTLVNLAILYQETGDYTGARQRYERALVLGEQFRGPADLLTLHVLTGVAVVLSELGGDFAGSARLNERLLALTERAYRPDGSAPEDSAGKPGDGSTRSRRLRRSKGAGRTLAGHCRARVRSETRRGCQESAHAGHDLRGTG